MNISLLLSNKRWSSQENVPDCLINLLGIPPDTGYNEKGVDELVSLEETSRDVFVHCFRDIVDQDIQSLINCWCLGTLVNGFIKQRLEVDQ